MTPLQAALARAQEWKKQASPGPLEQNGPDIVSANGLVVLVVAETDGQREHREDYVDMCDVSAFDGTHPEPEANARLATLGPLAVDALAALEPITRLDDRPLSIMEARDLARDAASVLDAFLAQMEEKPA